MHTCRTGPYAAVERDRKSYHERSMDLIVEELCESRGGLIVQELCESRGGRPGLSVLTSLLVSVDVKIY